eukprot:4444101-Amphidinium_carterae.2
MGVLLSLLCNLSSFSEGTFLVVLHIGSSQRHTWTLTLRSSKNDYARQIVAQVHKIIMPPLLNADALWTLQKSIIDDDSKGYSRGPSITASGSLKC